MKKLRKNQADFRPDHNTQNYNKYYYKNINLPSEKISQRTIPNDQTSDSVENILKAKILFIC